MSDDLIVNIGADTSDLEDGISSVKQNLAIVSGTLIEFGGKIADAFKGVMDGVFEAQKSMTKFQNQTGVTTDEMKKYGKEIKDVYKNNWGESLDDVAEQMAIVKQQSGLLGISASGDIKDITKRALTLKDTFEFEVNESTRAAGSMFQNFGTTAKESFDYIAKGAQEGLNKSDDLLDTINEYSPNFKMIGFNANDMFNILKKGSESGVFTVDKVADSIKEFGIRVKDGSTTSAEAFKTLGFNADEMFKTFASGGEGSKEAFYKVIDALKNIEDPVKRNQVGVSLFGTMFEDMGEKSILNLGSVENAFKDAGGTIEEIDKNIGKDFQSTWDTIKRTIETDAIKPLGEALLPTLKEVSKIAQEYLPKISEAIKGTDPAIITAIAGIAGLITAIIPVIGVVGTLIPAFEAVGTAISGVVAWVGELGIFSTIGAMFAAIGAPIAVIVAIIGAVVGAIIYFKDYIYNSLKPVVDVLIKSFTSIDVSQIVNAFNLLKQSIEPLLPTLKTIGGIIVGVIVVALGIVISVINGVINAIIPAIAVIMNVVGIVSSALGLIIGILTLDGDTISKSFSALWENIKGIFVNSIGVIIGFVKGFVSGIIGFFQGLYDTLVGHSIIPDMVNGILNWFKNLWNSGVSIIQGFINGVANILYTLGSIAYNAFSNFVNTIRNFIGSAGSVASSIVNTINSSILGLAGGLYNAGRTLIQNVIDGLWSMLGSLKSTAGSIAKSIANFFPHSPAKEGALRDFPEVGYTLMDQLMSGIEAQRNNVSDVVASVTQDVSNNVAVNPSTGSTTGTVTIPIYLDGRKITEVVAPYMTKMIRTQVGY